MVDKWEPGDNMPQRDARLVAGAYRIGQTIAQDGLLMVSTAHNLNTNDVIGLYVIEISPTAQAQNVRQLLKPLAQRQLVQSPHVLKIHDWGLDGNRVYIASGPPRGTTLRYLLDTENIRIARTLTLLQQLIIGIKAFHDKGISGLELRPQYLTVDTLGGLDRVQIDDLGLRTLLQALASIGAIDKGSAFALATPDLRYAAPEYVRAGLAGPESDIYQVGLLLFELITGRLPFVGQDDAETGEMQRSSPIPHMKQYIYDMPEALQEIVEHALAKEPGKRFASTGEFLTALQRVNLPTRTDPNLPAIGHVGITPSDPGTNEMSSINTDITTQATLIEKQGTAQSATPKLKKPESGDAFAYLCQEEQGAVSHRIALKQRVCIIGRSDPKRGYTPDVDLNTLDTKMTVSRQHARIRFEETFFSIEDLKSRNKTRLNELALAPLKSEPLRDGDIIHFGSVRLKFEIAE
jgi:serine/threonine protein kinase